MYLVKKMIWGGYVGKYLGSGRMERGENFCTFNSFVNSQMHGFLSYYLYIIWIANLPLHKSPITLLSQMLETQLFSLEHHHGTFLYSKMSYLKCDLARGISKHRKHLGCHFLNVLKWVEAGTRHVIWLSNSRSWNMSTSKSLSASASGPHGLYCTLCQKTKVIDCLS